MSAAGCRIGRLAGAVMLLAIVMTPTWAQAARAFTLSTWNLEWLISPETDQQLRPACQRMQPRSHERALPCTPGRAAPPKRTREDFDALARTAGRLLQEQQADVVALQEVDGPEAARQVFRQGWTLDCFVRRAHPQKVGFAIRQGIPYRCNGDLSALDVDGSSRGGADVSLWPGTPQEVRLLAVHLKSGCFDGQLDRAFGPCTRLRQQVPLLEQWMDARAREGVAFAILGDFNRHLDKDSRLEAGADESAPLSLMNALSDQHPRGATLLRATEGAPYVRCTPDDEHNRYIDDVLLSQALVSRARSTRFVRVPLVGADGSRQLSDHCPLGATLEGLAP